MPQLDVNRNASRAAVKKSRRKPKRPSATNRARATERAYRSQGRQVQHAANQQRQTREHAASRRPVAFRALPKRNAPFRVQRQRARRDAERADRRVSRSAAIPRIPLLKHYTQPQREAIQRTYTQAAHRAGVRNPIQLYALGSTRQRREMTQVSQRLRRSETRDAERTWNRLPPWYRRAYLHTHDLERAPNRPFKPNPHPVQTSIAGIPVERVLSDLDERLFPRSNPGLRVAKVPLQLARATIEDPAAVAKSSARTAVESIAGIPMGVKAIVDDPSKALKAIAQDYEKRYGPIVEGNTAKFREQVKSDYGLTPFLADIGGAASAGGRAAGVLARSGAYGRAVEALRTATETAPRGLGGGRLAHGAVRGLQEVQRTASRERPMLREFAGEGGARAQRTSRNLLVAGGQRVLDRARRRRFAGQLRKAGFEDAGAGRVRVREGAEKVSRLPGLRPGQGEVLRLPNLRNSPMLKRLAGHVARDIGGAKSMTRVRLLQHRAKTLRNIDRRVADLTPAEQRALKYVRQLGLPAGADLNASVRALQRRLAQIRRERGARGFKGTPATLRDTADDARAIRTILKDPEAHLTAHVREIADELNQVTRLDEALDPDLTPDRALIRELRPQAALLGVKRGPDVELFNSVLDHLEHKISEGEHLTPGTVRATFGELAKILPEARTARARELEAELRKVTGAAGRNVSTAQRRVAVLQNVIRERERHGQPLSTDELQATRAELATATREARQLRTQRDRLMGESKGANMEADRIPGVTYGPDFRRGDRTAALADVRARLAAAENRVKGLRGAVREAEREAPRVAPKMHERLAEFEQDLALSREARDAARQLHGIARKVTALTKHKGTMRLESAEAFDRKVHAAAEAEGLVEPGYWMSSARPREDRSLAAVGTGGRAAAKSKRYTGKLFDLGIEEVGPDALRRGAERNIKRRFSWALTSRNMEVHSFEWSRGDQGEGLAAGELLRELDERAIDPASVALINPRIARKRSLDTEGVERGRVVDDAADEQLDDTALGEIHQDLKEAIKRPDTIAAVEDLANGDVRGQAMNRYLVVPRDVADELEAATKPDGALARSLQIVLNQKPARILLGTLNAPWLMFQVASNALLTGLGGGRNPLDIYGAHKWWRGLDDAEKEAVEAELGITHGHHWGIDQAQLGAASEKLGPARHLVDFYRAYKKSRVGRFAHKINPLDAMFRADEAQNNFFRKVLFYNQAKKSAYRRMGSHWRSMDRLQGTLAGVLGLPPERMGAQIARHGPEFEQHAQHVRDFLGDYLRFSDHERKLLSRNVMFYGYLRYSLRFAFYTMPIQHPIMAGILGNIGRLGAQEIKDLFGVPSNYRLPTTMLAQAYYGNRADAKAGRLKSINFGRFNPFLNSVTQLESEQQLVGLVSPIYQAVADQFFEESSFTGRDYRINRIPTPSEAERPKDYFGSIFGTLVPGRPRNRILTHDLLGLAFPYRVAEKTGIPEVRLPLLGKVPGTGVAPLEGPQGDDTLLWSPRPTGYRDEETVQSIRRSIRKDRKRGGARRLLEQAAPIFMPQITRAPQVIEREREKEKAVRARRKRGRRPSVQGAARYGGGSSGNAYGGTSRRSSKSLTSRYGG